MDTKKESRIPECGNVPDLTGVKTVVGAKQLKKAVEAGRARYVFLAENADPAVIEPVSYTHLDVYKRQVQRLLKKTNISLT